MKISFNPKKKKINKRRLVTTIVIASVLILLLITFIIYKYNENFRKFIDINILRKEISEKSSAIIEIEAQDLDKLYGYDKYIALLSKNKLLLYNNSAKLTNEIEMSITNPAFSSNNRFLCVFEENGQNLYVIDGEQLIWKKTIEGNISNVNVNKNGYICVIISGTTYKTVIATFSPDGKELFKTYLANTNTVDVDISNDNKYLAIAEVDTTATAIQSNIKIVSVEKAQLEGGTNSIIYTYNANINDLIINIKYQNKNKLICMYDNGIHTISEEEDKKIIDLSDKKDIFASIDLKENIVKVTEKASLLFSSDSEATIFNVDSERQNIYTINGIPKCISTYENIIALNLGTEVHLIDTNGWLMKKYISTQEIKNVVFNSNFAGIVFSDRVEIINL